MALQSVTILGGTGFLGHRIVDRLLKQGLVVRVAARHPEHMQVPKEAKGRAELIQTDIRDPASVAKAVSGVQGVVNAVSLYVENDNVTFEAVHVDGARTVAEMAQRHGIERLVHLSGIGSDPTSASNYIRSRGKGEQAVREVFEAATIFRPSVMFGKDDAFLNTLVSLCQSLPVLPLFGRGKTKLQPVFVGDVAQAAENVLTYREHPHEVYELGGPDILTYRELLEMVLRITGRKRPMVPVPFVVWDALAAVAQILPSPPLTEGQIALLKQHNVVSLRNPGLHELEIPPTAVATILRKHFATNQS